MYLENRSGEFAFHAKSVWKKRLSAGTEYTLYYQYCRNAGTINFFLGPIGSGNIGKLNNPILPYYENKIMAKIV